MEIKDLPNEIQNKIFYYLEHPISTIFKKEFNIELLSNLEFAVVTCKSSPGKCTLRLWNNDIILSEQYERKIKAYKMKFVDYNHYRKWIYYG
jgi:hypothetical protein